MKKIISLFLMTLFFSTTFCQNIDIIKINDLINEKRYDDCLVIIKKEIDINKKNNNVLYYYKAKCEHGKKQYNESIISASKSLELTNKNDSLIESILLLRKFSYAYAGKLELAILDNEELIKVNPNQIGYLTNLSYFYGELRKFDKSIEILKKAYLRDTLNINTLVNLAYYSNEIKDYNSTILYSKKGLKITKDTIWIASLLNSMGFAVAKNGAFQDGLGLIYKSIIYRADTPYPYFNIGKLYLDQKDINNACIYFQKAKNFGGINMTYNYIKDYCK